jgi:Xaa-Pro aminopeptidase
MIERLQQRLEELDAVALVVPASTGTDPDFLPFLGEGRISQGLVVVPRGGVPHLLYYTPMERQEAGLAAATGAAGCRLLTPERLDLMRWQRECLTPEEWLATVVGQAFLHAGVRPEGASRRVLLAGHEAAGKIQAACRLLAREGWTFQPGHDAVAWARRRKDEGQVREMRRVAAAVRSAFQRVAALLRAAVVDAGKGRGLILGGSPLTVGRLKGEIATVFAQATLEQPEGGIVAPAEEGAVPHNQGTPDRVLRAGESLVVDLFPRGRLFADCTRTFCVGEPPEGLARAHRAVHQALLQAHRGVRAGVATWDLQQRTCDLLEAAGYATSRSEPGTLRGYVHGLGHGVGYELHDAPSFKEQARGEMGTLLEGDVVTLEPGLYDPEAGFGVRLEDLVWVGEVGAENWTPLPYALDPRAWPEEALDEG